MAHLRRSLDSLLTIGVTDPNKPTIETFKAEQKIVNKRMAGKVRKRGQQAREEARHNALLSGSDYGSGKTPRHRQPPRRSQSQCNVDIKSKSAGAFEACDNVHSDNEDAGGIVVRPYKPKYTKHKSKSQGRLVAGLSSTESKPNIVTSVDSRNTLQGDVIRGSLGRLNYRTTSDEHLNSRTDRTKSREENIDLSELITSVQSLDKL